MRVLAHIHTLNDQDVIEQVLDSLCRQTRPPDAIIIVDNGSTDRTLDRDFPECVTVVRNGENLGTSGAIRIGFAHALERGFDCTWVFDADSVPELDALDKLLAFYEDLPQSEKQHVCFVACRPTTVSGEPRDRPMVFTESGIDYTPLEADDRYSACDCTLWTGSLYMMSAVEKIGLPSADYVLDVAELEYGYRARQLGYRSYIVHSGVLHQDVGRDPGITTAIRRLGPIGLKLYESSPIRCYYNARNRIYFWLYQCKPRRMGRVFRSILRSLAITSSFAVRPVSRRRQLVACLRGIWDGLTMHMERRY